jgi:hypothetical protein
MTTKVAAASALAASRLDVQFGSVAVSQVHLSRHSICRGPERGRFGGPMSHLIMHTVVPGSHRTHSVTLRDTVLCRWRREKGNQIGSVSGSTGRRHVEDHQRRSCAAVMTTLSRSWQRPSESASNASRDCGSSWLPTNRLARSDQTSIDSALHPAIPPHRTALQIFSSDAGEVCRDITDAFFHHSALNLRQSLEAEFLGQLS